MHLYRDQMVDLMASSGDFREMAADILVDPPKQEVDFTRENQKLLATAVQLFDPRHEKKGHMVRLLRLVGRGPNGKLIRQNEARAFVENNVPQYHPLYRRPEADAKSGSNRVKKGANGHRQTAPAQKLSA